VTDQYHDAFLKIPQLTPCNNAHISACSCSRKTIQQIASPPSIQTLKIATQGTTTQGKVGQTGKAESQIKPPNTPRAPGYRRHQVSKGMIFVVQSSSDGSYFEQNCPWQHR
jgi:hypothetical protein